MAKYVIDDSTLESLGNAVRLKSGARVDLKPSQMINLINNLPTNASHALQTALTPLLPNLRLGEMNDEQFVHTIDLILTADVNTPSGQMFKINDCRTISIGEGTPLISITREPIQTFGEYQAMLEEAVRNATEPTIIMLGEIFIGDDENE